MGRFGRYNQGLTLLALLIAAVGTVPAFGDGPNIPGVSGRYDTEGMIEEILEAEKEPIRRQENRIDELEQERAAWRRIGQRLSALENSAQNLFGFRNPFADRRVQSSDPNAVTAQADRDAEQQRTMIEVERIATADIFQSDPVPIDYEVPSGEYTFSVGDERRGFAFDGGGIDDFVGQVNRRLSDILQIRSVRNTRDTRVLVFRSQIPGAGNRLQFEDAAERLALATGVIEEVRADELDATPTTANTTLQDGDRGEALFEDDESLKVGPTAEATVESESLEIAQQYVLELEIAVENLGRPEHEEPEPPDGPQIPPVGDVELDGVTVPFADSLFDIPDWEAPEPPEEVEDPQFLYILSGGEQIPAGEIDDTEGFVRLEVPVGEITDVFDGFRIENRNTFREVYVRNAVVRDPESHDGFRPRIAIEEAGDAVFTLDGVRVTRDTNEIDDVLDDITLELREAGTGPVALDIEPDFDRIEERVIEFLANYNELITEINILTRTDREIIDQLDWLEPDEVEAAEERLGMLQGNTTLNQLRSRLQTIMMNPYETRAGDRIRLLAHIGVSSNTSGFGQGVDMSRMRGYLELDDEQFDSSIVNDHGALRDLFGRDSSGNGAIDSGVAYEVLQYVQAFTRTGGLLANREQTIESSIDRAETEISRQNERIDRREQQLRREFGEMERAVEEMEGIRGRLEGLQNQGQQN